MTDKLEEKIGRLRELVEQGATTGTTSTGVHPSGTGTTTGTIGGHGTPKFMKRQGPQGEVPSDTLDDQPPEERGPDVDPENVPDSEINVIQDVADQLGDLDEVESMLNDRLGELSKTRGGSGEATGVLMGLKQILQVMQQLTN